MKTLRILALFLALPSFSQNPPLPLSRLENYAQSISQYYTEHVWNFPIELREFAEYQAGLTAESIFSWIMLTDAKKDNPFYSAELISLNKTHPQCLKRLYLELAESKLEEFSSKGIGFTLAYLFHMMKYFETQPWLYKAIALEGTETYAQSTAYNFFQIHPTDTMTDAFKGMRQAFNRFFYRPEQNLESIVEARSCKEESGKLFNRLFSWLDVQAFEEVSRDYSGTPAQKTNLEALVKSTASPESAPHSGPAFGLHPKLSLRPIANLKSNFLDDLLWIAAKTIQEHGNFMSKESCRALLPLSTIASILGAEIRPQNTELWKLWMNLRLASIAASTAGVKECESLTSFIENVTPSAIGFPALYALVRFSSDATKEKFEITAMESSVPLKGRVSRSLQKKKIAGVERLGVNLPNLR